MQSSQGEVDRHFIIFLSRYIARYQRHSSWVTSADGRSDSVGSDSERSYLPLILSMK
jgi:hypothetical protein